MPSDIHDFPKPSVTVDIVIFTVKDDDLKVLLIKRAIDPGKGKWALPGGFMDIKESLDAAAQRKLEEKTGVNDVYLEQLYTFGDPKRDTRGRVLTVAYYALLDSSKIEPRAGRHTTEAQWHSVYKLPQLAFDHKQILDYALQRLRYKLEYTAAAFELVPDEFTLSELQKVYEIIFDKELDKRNFRKKVQSIDIIKATGRTKLEGAHRPAQLYTFKNKDIVLKEKGFVFYS